MKVYEIELYCLAFTFENRLNFFFFFFLTKERGTMWWYRQGNL